MSTIYNFGGTVNYNDNSKNYHVEAKDRDLKSIINSCDIKEDETLSVSSEYNSDPSIFPYLTQKCFNEKRVETVEAEIQAARKGTAETMWRTLWNNENLGYIEVEPIDATTLYRAIEKWYGKLPYKERNFREARNKR